MSTVAPILPTSSVHGLVLLENRYQKVGFTVVQRRPGAVCNIQFTVTWPTLERLALKVCALHSMNESTFSACKEWDSLNEKRILNNNIVLSFWR